MILVAVRELHFPVDDFVEPTQGARFVEIARMKVFRCESPSAGIGLTRLKGNLTPLYDTKNRHS